MKLQIESVRAELADATGEPIDWSRTRRLWKSCANGGSIVLAYSPPVCFDLPDDGEAVVHRLGVAATRVVRRAMAMASPTRSR